MKSPSLYTLEALRDIINKPNVMAKTPTSNGYVPARSEGYYSLRERCKLAWMVFTGKADAFTWPGGQ